MYEYHHEQIIDSEFASKSALLANIGWRLVAVVINPLFTTEEAPIYITFWERPIP